ncbi:reverse transcriptase domain-containing protein [Tanacetum coccineum]|uniref:Reverse transcriptase domain-containing protein n=1 Tax=Tanacetum coccineum TaxID=301880 RepID=A0ABQ5B6K7_9ASTR
MAKEDEEKTTSITSQGVFCYSKMSFGLKNARATYQRLVDKAFQKKIGRNLEVYVDDLVIKSRTGHEIIRDMEETFKTLREINMKLNPKKYAFGIEEGMFLGYKVNTEGKNEKSLPFFKTLKKCTKKSDFQWTAKAEAAFKEMKKLIAKLLTLIAPIEKKELIKYLATAREAPRSIRSRDKLHVNGKVGASFSTCKQAIKKILPGSHNHCHHGPANQADTVKTRGRKKAAELEY